ncbi:MAG: chemotaxis response regulator protein-glutamate methylesterase [Thermaerobacter sp.]|nr:chemotaxis response regulator protein-glutamate methylesterase [Thermaerobacter sp.]
MSTTVLIADDSVFMRHLIQQFLTRPGEIEVVGTARNGREAVEMVHALHPDVVTMDVEMPVMSGLEAVERIMRERPTPIVMVSSLTEAGAEVTLQALSLGAVDFIAKPDGGSIRSIGTIKDELVRKVLACRQAHLPGPRPAAPLPVLHAGPGRGADRFVVIGSSTGGPNALQQIIPRLPEDLGARVLVVQHMPPGFTRSLALRLDHLSALPVREAADGEVPAPGTVLVAPGGFHTLLSPEGAIRLTQDPPVHGVRPAVDPAMETAARHFGSRTVGMILTGMGFDGARGMAQIKAAGGRTIAQDEASCVVYGMPKAVVEMGNADVVAPLDQLAASLVRCVGI